MFSAKTSITNARTLKIPLRCFCPYPLTNWLYYLVTSIKMPLPVFKSLCQRFQTHHQGSSTLKFVSFATWPLDIWKPRSYRTSETARLPDPNPQQLRCQKLLFFSAQFLKISATKICVIKKSIKIRYQLNLSKWVINKIYQKYVINKIYQHMLSIKSIKIRY